ncbi:hypothetical protein BT93_K1339 [Corymbia citriodora subsp. variegata]|nr:hypothetical protein BT93_K1339 [Corymbia citriodora subsp. variegata]
MTRSSAMSSATCSSCCRRPSSSSPSISAPPTPFPSTSKFKPVLTIKPHATTTTIPKMSLDPRDFRSPAPQPPSSSSLLAALTALLWGPSLPPGLLVSSVRSAWTAAWRLMMSQLAPSDPSGRYARPASSFRLAGPSGLSGPRRPGALHLYVGLPCPWAHRALVVRALKGLEEAVPVSVASPGVDGSWEFRDPPGPERGDLAPGRDRVNGCRNLREVYGRRRGGYSGRCTVPMLWDVDRSDVACNESYDIIKVFNSGLNGLARNPEVDLSPPELAAEIEEWNRVIYPGVNNGVYRCGFEPGSVRRGGGRAVPHPGHVGRSLEPVAVLVRRWTDPCGRVSVHDLGPVRSRVQCALQVHEEEAGGVPQPSWLHARHISGTESGGDLRL